MYLRVREILALAADYEPRDEDTQVFFQTVQNKLHFAVTGMTAPQLIAERAEHTKPNMGLTTWKGTVVRRADAGIAKNYLNESEISELNRIVTMFLDFAEDQAKRRRQVFMGDWKERLDAFLKLNERLILSDAGRVSRETAEEIAEKQYELFEKRRRKKIEAAAEAENMKALEEAAKKLPVGKNRQDAKGADNEKGARRKDRQVGAAIEVHRVLGPGYLESVYEEALTVELELRGIPFDRQKGISVDYKGHAGGAAC